MKLNFFSRIYLAITDFRLYPFVVQKEKFATAYAYFLCFIILVSIVLATNTTVKVLNWGYSFANDYPQQMKEFLIKDGELTVLEELNIDYLDVRIMTESQKKLQEIDLNQLDFTTAKAVVIAYKDGVAFGNGNIGLVPIQYQELPITLTKTGLYQLMINALNSPLFKASLIGIMFCGIFLSYFITRFFYVLMITLMLLFLGFVFKTNYKFKDYMKAAFYIITLPTITEIIAFLVVGELNQYAYITYYLLTYVYIFYAIRALKLDNIIIATQERLMNLKNEPEEKETEQQNTEEQNHTTKENENEEEKK